MKNHSPTDIQQDTLIGRSVVVQDTIKTKSDSSSITKNQRSNLTGKLPVTTKYISVELTDTISVCPRNRVADITFYDSTNFVKNSDFSLSDPFPFLFIEKNRRIEKVTRESLLKHLKPGQELPQQPLHDDWIIGIALITGFLYSLIRNTSKRMLPDVSQFFLFRGINDPSSRDIGGLFHWQSTILNLISFLVIALFVYCAASYYNFVPFGLNGILFWLISLGVIISAVTLRHIVCTITGNISGKNEVFREYLLGIYQSYRFSALFFFVIVIFMSYTTIMPPKFSFTAGVLIFGLMYLIRIVRLLIIFINRNISIFYLILYLCALEFLPVVISVKYISGLV